MASLAARRAFLSPTKNTKAEARAAGASRQKALRARAGLRNRDAFVLFVGDLLVLFSV
jgi:hypothetical protein